MMKRCKKVTACMLAAIAMSPQADAGDIIAAAVGNNGSNGLLFVAVAEPTTANPYVTELYWQNTSTGRWDGATALNSLASGAKYVWMGAGSGGNLQAIYLSPNGQPYVDWQTPDPSSENGNWTGPSVLPNPSNIQFSTIALVRGNDGNLQVIALGQTDGLPYLIWQNVSTGAWNWGGKLPVVGATKFTTLAAGKGNGGNAQVVLLDTTGVPYLLWQDDSTGGWSWYGRLPNPNNVTFSTLAIGSGSNGNLQVAFVGANDGEPYLVWQNSQTGSWTWYGQLPTSPNIKFNSPSASFGGQTIAAAPGNNGNLQIILIDTSNSPDLIWQDSSTGTWYWGGSLPNAGRVQALAVTAAAGNSGNLQVLVVAAYASLYVPYLIWQNNSNGNWTWYGKLP